MKSDGKIVAFGAFQPFLRIINTYNSSNFQNFSCRAAFSSISRAIGLSISIFCLNVSIVGHLWYCSINNFDFRKNALPMAVLAHSMALEATYITLGLKRRRIKQIVDTLREVVNKRCERSMILQAHYEKLEKRFALFVSIGVKCAIFIIVGFSGALAMVPMPHMAFGYPQPNQWPSMTGVSLPMPSQIPDPVVGYYINWLLQAITCIMYYIIVLTSALYFIGMCIYIDGMVRDLRVALFDLDDTPRISTKRIIDEVLFHNSLLDLATSVQEIMSTVLFVQLLVCAVSLAIYMVGIETYEMLSMNFFASMCGLSSFLTTTYVYCLFSENFTANLCAVAESYFNVAWYRLPVKQQQLFILPIQRAQKECRLTGLGLVECSLRVFSSIMRAAWSYFLFMHGAK